MRPQIQEAEKNSLLHKVTRLNLIDRVQSSEMEGVELILLCIKRFSRCGHLIRMIPGRLPLEVFCAHPTGRRLWGRPRTCRTQNTEFPGFSSFQAYSLSSPILFSSSLLPLFSQAFHFFISSVSLSLCFICVRVREKEKIGKNGRNLSTSNRGEIHLPGWTNMQ